MQMLAWAFARHGRNHIIRSSSSRIPPKVSSFSISNLLLVRSYCSYSSCKFSSYLSSNNKCNYNPPPRFFSQISIADPPDDVTAAWEEEFKGVLSLVRNAPSDWSLIVSCLNVMHLPALHQHTLLKIIQTPNVLPHNLICFIKWAWKNKNNKKLFKVKVITTPVLESLVSAICCNATGEEPQHDLFLQLRHREKDILFLWDLVKDIGHNDCGVLSVRLLNQLIISFSVLTGQGKPALEAFLKFEEVFQCVPNQDTYYFTMHALYTTRNMFHHAAWSLCQKMLLDPERLLPDDGEKVGDMLHWFCVDKMRNEAYALYLAANEKRKRNPNWSLRLGMLIPDILVTTLSEKKETVQLALEILTDIDIPEEVGMEEEGAKEGMCLEVVEALCRFKDFDAAKQLILKMIADGPLPPPRKPVFNIIITAYINAGEMGQAMEMVNLWESIGLYTSHVLMCGSSHSDGMEEAKKILEEAKKQHSKFIPMVYHTLICLYCKQEQFDEALKLLTEMKDFGVCRPNVDEYKKLIRSLRLKAMDWEMAEKLLEEMNLNIRASF